MYNEADDRMVEQGITADDVNRELGGQISAQNTNNFNVTNFVQPSPQTNFCTGASQIVQAKPFQHPIQVERIEPQKENFKRQKVSEDADFTSNSLMVPISKNLSKISATPASEDNWNSSLRNDQSTAKHNMQNVNFQSGAKSSDIQATRESEKVTSSVGVGSSKATSGSNIYKANLHPEIANVPNDQSFKDKEQLIKMLEKREESKIIDKYTDELSLQIQKSIYKNYTPLY